MFKTIVTLIRGASARAEEDFADRHALLILDQQICDAASATEGAKRALSIAIAQDESEGKRLGETLQRIADLEERATRRSPTGVTMLPAGGRSDRADGDRPGRHGRGAAGLRADVAMLKSAVAKAGHRLAELERGRRIALATSRSGASRRDRCDGKRRNVRACRRGKDAPAAGGRQAEEPAAATAYASLGAGPRPSATAGRLEAAAMAGQTRRPLRMSARPRKKSERAAGHGVTNRIKPQNCQNEYRHVDRKRLRPISTPASWIAFTYRSSLPAGAEPERPRLASSRSLPLTSGSRRTSPWAPHFSLQSGDHDDQDTARRARNRVVREPYRGRQGRAPFDGDRARQELSNGVLGGSKSSLAPHLGSARAVRRSSSYPPVEAAVFPNRAVS